MDIAFTKLAVEDDANHKKWITQIEENSGIFEEGEVKYNLVMVAVRGAARAHAQHNPPRGGN
ncbi:MAG: hypothetical protein AAFV07_10420, partial [Bacteroidota bacterium]